jgi:hypothetical protein
MLLGKKTVVMDDAGTIGNNADQPKNWTTIKMAAAVGTTPVANLFDFGFPTFVPSYDQEIRVLDGTPFAKNVAPEGPDT